MSRHLLIRCDRDGCHEQTETRASDTAPTTIGVPSGWLTLVTEGIPDKHYCSLLCMIQAHMPVLPAAPLPPMTITAGDHTTPLSPYATPAPVAPEPLKSPPRSRKSAKS